MKTKLDPEGLGIILLGPFLQEFFPEQVISASVAAEHCAASLLTSTPISLPQLLFTARVACLETTPATAPHTAAFQGSSTAAASSEVHFSKYIIILHVNLPWCPAQKVHLSWVC